MRHTRKTGAQFADNVFLANLYDSELLSWFEETLKIALEAVRPPDAPLPRIIDMQDVQEADPLRWIGFENYLVVSDRCALRSACLLVTMAPKRNL